MPDKLLFLTSTKFWCFIAIAVIQYFKAVGSLDVAVADSVVTALGGYIGLNIVNKIVK
jgi:hypothetical protein